MQERSAAGQVRGRIGGMQDRKDAGEDGCRTDQMPDKMDAEHDIYIIQYRTDAVQVSCGKDRCRTGLMKDRSSAERDIYSTGRMQDIMDAGQVPSFGGSTVQGCVGV